MPDVFYLLDIELTYSIYIPLPTSVHCKLELNVKLAPRHIQRCEVLMKQVVFIAPRRNYVCPFHSSRINYVSVLTAMTFSILGFHLYIVDH